MLASKLLTYRVRHIVAATILSINSLSFSNSVCAQIVPDATINTQVNLIDGQQQITGGIESKSGKNLFHSFQEFSPTADFVTHFDNNNNIQNIFTRVTGNSASLIDGLIKTNGNASLFILNPAGITFGNNAQFNIGGSFIATTAESIIFADGTKFDAQLDNTSPLLTVSIPVGLQYGNSPGAIASNNTNPINLKVPSGKTIAFLGGNIELQNISIEALSGKVEIGSVAEGSIVGLDTSIADEEVSTSINIWEFKYDNVSHFNDIKISQASRIETSGRTGNINFVGKDIILNPGSNIINDTNTDIDGGIISLLSTNNIVMNNSLLATQVALLDQNGGLLGPVQGRGGDIKIKAKDIKISNGSVISTSTFNQGAGGDIIINAIKSVKLTGFNDVSPSLILSAVVNKGVGGDVRINTGTLEITDSARIDSSTFGEGKAGNIVVNAHGSILISGSKSFFNNNFNEELKFNSGLIASSGFEGLSIPDLGESGSVTINTPRLFIEDGGEISVSNFGEENAGDIEVHAGELIISGDSKIISKRASGDKGSITITGGELILEDTAEVATNAEGTGAGGNINIETNNIVMFYHTKINANASEGQGGNITITTQSLLTQDNPETMITASSGVEGLQDGEITINTPDTDSKLETTEARINPLAGEESIDTSCALGNDFSANRFVYVGRGGIRKGPFDSADTQEVIGDLGLEESALHGFELNSNHNSSHNIMENTPKSIVEATNWIVNKRGKVELIAQASNIPLASGCLFNQSWK